MYTCITFWYCQINKKLSFLIKRPSKLDLWCAKVDILQRIDLFIKLTDETFWFQYNLLWYTNCTIHKNTKATINNITNLFSIADVYVFNKVIIVCWVRISNSWLAFLTMKKYYNHQLWNLKLASANFYQIFIFHQTITF